MFTIEQIRTAHSKVKSGADFPKYISEIKLLGVMSYEHYVAAGHIVYHGANGFIISGPAMWEVREINTKGNATQLRDIISTHQQGQTDYITFCHQVAEAGVEKWVIDIPRLTCSYYDLAGNEMVVEPIPESDCK